MVSLKSIVLKLLIIQIEQVHSLVFALSLAAFTNSTTLSTYIVPVFLNNARAALVRSFSIFLLTLY